MIVCLLGYGLAGIPKNCWQSASTQRRYKQHIYGLAEIDIHYTLKSRKVLKLMKTHEVIRVSSDLRKYHEKIGEKIEEFKKDISVEEMVQRAGANV